MKIQNITMVDKKSCSMEPYASLAEAILAAEKAYTGTALRWGHALQVEGIFTIRAYDSEGSLPCVYEIIFEISGDGEHVERDTLSISNSEIQARLHTLEIRHTQLAFLLDMVCSELDKKDILARAKLSRYKSIVQGMWDSFAEEKQDIGKKFTKTTNQKD